VRLSVLDLSPIPSGGTAATALANTLDLARFADARGLHRYWLAEHHNAGGLASSSPEIMIGQVARETTRIRVGAGGVMLPNHAPLRVAESFRVLHALFPGRLDLGLGRAAGTDPRTARALRDARGSTADGFPAQLDELVGYLDDPCVPRRAFEAKIYAIPTGVAPPDLWILGSSDAGAALAAARGLPFAFAHHQNPTDATTMLRRYRDEFVPSWRRAAPEAILAVSVVCADTDTEAARLATSAELAWVRFTQGYKDFPLPSVEEALAHEYDAEEEAFRSANVGRIIVGSPATVGATLRSLAEAAGADELMLMVGVHDHDARKHAYALVAEALGISTP
jgi:luciferase family oxidoreductase group 1